MWELGAASGRGRARRALDGASQEFWDAALAVFFAYAKLRAFATVQTGPLIELVSFPQVLRKQDELWEAGRRLTVAYYNLRMTGRKQRVRAAEAITDAQTLQPQIVIFMAAGRIAGYGSA